MQVPTLPDSAPFTAAQRAWLSGFFAGLLGFEQGPGAFPAALAVPASGEAVRVPVEPVEEDLPWHDPSLSMEERLRLAEGRPLERVLMAAMAQLDCGACGYVCRTYSAAIARGEEKSLGLCAPGGRETAAKLREIVAARRPAPAPEFGEELSSRTAAAAPATSAPVPGAVPHHDRKDPFPARFVRSVRLNGAGSAKDTRLVVLDLEGSGIAYEPGDSLGVYPENCPELVQQIMDAVGAAGGEQVPAPDGGTVALQDALLRHYSITRPTGDLLSLLARRAGGVPPLGGSPGGLDTSEDLEIIDLLEASPRLRLDPAELVAALERLRPRLYSISSSLKAHPDEVHLTVGVVRYDSRGRVRKGVASTFLAERVTQGHRVRVFVQDSHGFRLPDDGGAPTIMIGPGTGIAPFRAFLEERRVRAERGRNWLFFGGQRMEHDFLYRDELEAYVRDGILARLDTAFSRDQAEKVYVQHRMLEASRELWAWLGEGAHVYVCGDARRMAGDVDRALRQVIARAGMLSEAEAKQYLDGFVRRGRYRRDVY